MLSPAVIALIFAAVLAGVVYLFRPQFIKRIRGPPSPSIIFGKSEMDQSVRLLLTQVMGPGHEHALNWQKEVGDMEIEWLRTYGPTWRIRGNFGVSLHIWDFL